MLAQGPHDRKAGNYTSGGGVDIVQKVQSRLFIGLHFDGGIRTTKETASQERQSGRAHCSGGTGVVGGDSRALFTSKRC